MQTRERKAGVDADSLTKAAAEAARQRALELAASAADHDDASTQQTPAAEKVDKLLSGAFTGSTGEDAKLEENKYMYVGVARPVSPFTPCPHVCRTHVCVCGCLCQRASVGVDVHLLCLGRMEYINKRMGLVAEEGGEASPAAARDARGHTDVVPVTELGATEAQSTLHGAPMPWNTGIAEVELPSEFKIKNIEVRGAPLPFAARCARRGSVLVPAPGHRGCEAATGGGDGRTRS